MALVLDGDNGIVGVLATNSDGDIIFDTNTLFVDAIENKVGIGTVNPSELLHANGSIRLTTDVSTTRRLYALSGTGSYSLNSSGGAAIAFHRDASNNDEIAFETHWQGNQHAERMRIDNQGNVGIGETTPAGKLEVQNTSVNYAILGTSNKGHYFESQSDDNTDGFEIYQQHGSTATRNSFIVNDNRTGSKSAALVVRSDGNVGIGTDNPLAALDVHGNVRLGAGGSVDIKMNTGGAGGITARQNSSDAGMLSMKITEPGSARGWGFEFGDGVAEILGNHYLRVEYPSGNTTLAGTLDVGGLLSFPSSGLVAVGSNSKQTIALPNDGGITIGSGYTFANIYGTGGNLHLRANSYIANTGTPSQITLSTASAGGGGSPDVTIKEGFVSSKKGTIQTVLNQSTLYTSINPINTWAEASSNFRVSITPRYSSGTKILGTFSIPINPQGASNILMAMNPWYSTDGGTTKTLLNQGGPAGSRLTGSHAWFRSSNGYDQNDMQNHIIHFGHTHSATTTLTFGFYFRSEGSNTTYFCYSGSDNGTWGWTAPVYMELREVETA